MAKRVKEKPVIFSTGWDTRGSGVGEPTAVIDLRNSWMSRDDIGAVESMPGESLFINWSGLTDDPLVSLAAGTNTRGTLSTDGEWPGEDIEAGTIGIIGVAQYGEIFYANYGEDVGGPDVDKVTGELIAAYSGGATGEKQWPFSGIVRLNDTFYIFQGVQESIRLPQKSVIGSTVIDDIGVARPDTTDNDDINLSLNTGGDDNVVGPVRYWITEIEQGNESALSKAIRRVSDSPYKLYFSGDTNVTWGNVHDLDTTAAFTVEFMVMIDDLPPINQFLFGKRADLNDSSPGWSFELRTGGKVWFVLSDGTNTVKISTTHPIVDYANSKGYGSWHRISVTFDPTGDGTVILYRDGEATGTNTDCSDVVSSSNAVAMTAGEDASGTGDCTAHMYDFRVWDAARSQADIRLDMKDALNGTETDLVGTWPCHEGSGTTLDDKHTNDNDGTISSETMWGENTSYGVAVINCGDGNRVDINFTSERFHGNSYNIYRSYRSGAEPFLAKSNFVPTGTTPGTTDVHIDDLHDDYLGDPQFVHGDQPNPKARPAIVHMNRIFIAHDSYLYWSDVANEESFWWEDASDPDGHNEVGNWLKVYPDDGDRITALVSDYDSIIIFKANHIYRLYGRKPEEFNLRPIVPSTSIPVAVGAPNASSVCATPDGIVFYWNRKVYMLSGGILKKISDPIEEPLNALNLTAGSENIEWYTASVSYWAGRNQIWVGIGDGASAANTSFIYDLTTQRWIGKRNRGYIDAQSLRSWGTWQGEFTDEKFIGGSPLGALDGRVIDIIDTGETVYASDTSYSTWMEVAPFFGGNLNNIKKFLWVDVIFEPQAAGEIDFTYWVDGKSASAVTETVPLTVTGTPARHKSRVNINANGESLSVKIGNTPDDDGMWKIFGLVYGYQDEESISR